MGRVVQWVYYSSHNPSWMYYSFHEFSEINMHSKMPRVRNLGHLITYYVQVRFVMPRKSRRAWSLTLPPSWDTTTVVSSFQLPNLCQPSIKVYIYRWFDEHSIRQSCYIASRSRSALSRANEVGVLLFPWSHLGVLLFPWSHLGVLLFPWSTWVYYSSHDPNILWYI